MKEELVTFDTAELAKEKGFNEPCEYIYNLKNKLVKKSVTVPLRHCVNIDGAHGGRTTAPTQSLLQKWLRETYKIIVEPWMYDNSDDFSFEFAIKVCYPKTWGERDEYVEDGFKTYEEALEKGLQEALKLI